MVTEGNPPGTGTTDVEISLPATPTKDDLERFKIAAEINLAEANVRKATVEAETAEYDLDWRRAAAGAGEYEPVLRYLFANEVDTRSVHVAIETISTWLRRQKTPDVPVIITINSPGGSIMDGLAFFDFLRSIGQEREIITHAVGEAASMAGILLQAGARRRMGPNAYMLIHEASWVAFGKSSEIEDRHKLLERLQDRIVRILAERSTLSVDEIKARWHRKDWWLDAEEALALGLVDEIG